MVRTLSGLRSSRSHGPADGDDTDFPPTGIQPATQPITSARGQAKQARKSAQESDSPKSDGGAFKVQLAPFKPVSRTHSRTQPLYTIHESPAPSQEEPDDQTDELEDDDQDSPHQPFQPPHGYSDSLDDETAAQAEAYEARPETASPMAQFHARGAAGPTHRDPFTVQYGPGERPQHRHPGIGFQSPVRVPKTPPLAPVETPARSKPLFGRHTFPNAPHLQTQTHAHAHALSPSASFGELDEAAVEVVQQYDEPIEHPPPAPIAREAAEPLPYEQAIEHVTQAYRLQEEENRVLTAENEQLQQQVEDRQATQEDLQKKLKESTDQVIHLEGKLERTEVEYESYKVRVHETGPKLREKNNAAMAQAEAACKVNADELKEQIATLREELVTAKQERDILKTDFAALTEQLNKLRGLRDECNNLIRAHAAILGDHQATKRMNEVLQDALDASNKDVAQWKHRYEQFEKTLPKATADLKDKVEAIQTAIDTKHEKAIEALGKHGQDLQALRLAQKPNAFSESDRKKRLSACLEKCHALGEDVDEAKELVEDYCAFMSAKVDEEIATRQKAAEENLAGMKRMTAEMQGERARSAALEIERDDFRNKLEEQEREHRAEMEAQEKAHGHKLQDQEKELVRVKIEMARISTEAAQENDGVLVSTLKTALEAAKETESSLKAKVASLENQQTETPAGTSLQRYEAQTMNDEDQALYDRTKKDVTSAWEKDRVELNNKIHRLGKHNTEKDVRIKTLEEMAQPSTKHQEMAAKIKSLLEQHEKDAAEIKINEAHLMNEQQSKRGLLEQNRSLEEDLMQTARERDELKKQLAAAKKAKKQSPDKPTPGSQSSTKNAAVTSSQATKAKTADSSIAEPSPSQAPKMVERSASVQSVRATQGTKRKPSEESYDPIEDPDKDPDYFPSASQSRAKTGKRVKFGGTKRIPTPLPNLPESSKCDPLGSQESVQNPVPLPRSQNRKTLRRSSRIGSEAPE